MLKSLVKPKKIHLNYLPPDSPPDAPLPQLELNFEKDLLIDQAIGVMVGAFNLDLESKGSGFRLSPNKDLYSLRLAKKSGRPKSDLPELDKQQPIGDMNFGALVLCPVESAIVVRRAARPQPAPAAKEEVKMEVQIRPVARVQEVKVKQKKDKSFCFC